MSKYIISCCFGGYGWSKEALDDLMKIKGREVDYWDLDLRSDPDAIRLLEEKGSKYCSGGFANLEIEEYDEDLWIPEVDEYDGFESLKLVPRLSESRIRNCRSFDEVIELLRRLNLFTEND